MSKIALVAIGRRENLYAREFVEHYKNLGFANVIIMDNNHEGEEHFEDVLQDYIDDGFVIIEDYRDQIKPQMRGYTTEYNKIKDEYDAILFADFDEFLVLEHDKTIQEYVSRFPEDWQAILINWDCKTDSGLVHYDPRPLVERFTVSLSPIDKPVQYGNIPENAHVKCILKGGRDGMLFYSNPHVPNTPLICYNASGIRCNNSPWQSIDWSTAHLRHFTTKTIEEWMTRKMQVGTPDREPSSFLPFYRDRFFKINQVTQEKLDWLKEHGYEVK